MGVQNIFSAELVAVTFGLLRHSFIPALKVNSLFPTTYEREVTFPTRHQNAETGSDAWMTVA